MTKKQPRKKKLMGHRRAPKITYIHPSKLITDPNFKYDQHLRSLLVQRANGSINIALTRLNAEEITSGFFERQSDKNVYITNLNKSSIPVLEKAIRSGVRPVITVYWNPLVPAASKYVCPDDEVTLAAYRKLNIRYLPCEILNPKDAKGSEASIWVKTAGEYTHYHYAIPPDIKSYSVLSSDGGISPELQIEAFINACAQLRTAIKNFHLSINTGVHYHQMLHALLNRHERILDSINQLIRMQRVEHAQALIRVAYEAFLNFYIDWISPSFFGQRLQLLAAIRQEQSNGKTVNGAILEQLGGFDSLLENTARKARISPLGDAFHDVVYPPLSLVSHQSYGYIEMEATSFSEKLPDNSPDYVDGLIKWLNFITAALLARVGNEIGSSTLDFEFYATA